MSYAVYPQYQQQPPQPQSNNLVWIVLIAVCAFLFVQNKNHEWPFKKDQQQQEQEDKKDDKGGDEETVASGGYLVFVYERTKTTVDQEMVLRSVSQYTVGKSLDGYREYDVDQVSAKPFLASGRLPPLVALVIDGKVKKTIPFPDTVTGLDELFKK